MISIRADFLSEVERYRKLMPSLAKGRYQIELLTGPQALDAVYRPGTLRSGDDPIIPLDIAEQIVRRVARADDGTPLEDLHAVPPLVSLFCSGINTKRLQAEDEAGARVTAALVQACGDQILPDFYASAFADVPSGAVVRAMIEDALVTEAGFRQSLPLPDAINALERLGLARGDAERALNILENHRLLAVQAHEGSRRVELIHDLLLDEVRKSRSERKRREAENLAAKQRQRIEKAEAMMEFILEGLSPRLDRTQRTQLFETVQAYYEQLEKWEREADESRSNQAALLRLMGQAKQQDGDLGGAREAYRASLDIYQRIGATGGAFSDAAAEVDRLLAQVGEQARTEQASASYDIYISYSPKDNEDGWIRSPQIIDSSRPRLSAYSSTWNRLRLPTTGVFAT
jgi:tetratricopeptide (TPR) repeat protein